MDLSGLYFMSLHKITHDIEVDGKNEYSLKNYLQIKNFNNFT